MNPPNSLKGGNMGVLSDLLRARFGIETRESINPIVAAVGVAAVVVIRNHPDRVGFVIVNLSANPVYLAPDGGALATYGIRLDPNGGFLSMIWDEDFELVSHEWWGIAPAGASNIFVSEVIGEKVSA